MKQDKELKTGIYVSQKTICRDLGISRSTIFRVIQKYKKIHNTNIVPGKHETILGSYVFEKSIFIDWFKSIYLVSNVNNSPTNLFSNQKLNNFSTEKNI
jgi:hypothetical protein